MPTAKDNRRILANAHAAWIARGDQPALKAALVEADYMASTDLIAKVRMIGTSVQITIDADDFIECIELDAYGNVLRGEPD